MKGLELECHGEHRVGVYQELARGFGVDEYKPLLASIKANETRLKTANEFGNKEMGDAGFGLAVVRHILLAICKTVETESPRDGLTWLTTEVKDYASNRTRILDIEEGDAHKIIRFCRAMGVACSCAPGEPPPSR